MHKHVDGIPRLWAVCLETHCMPPQNAVSAQPGNHGGGRKELCVITHPKDRLHRLYLLRQAGQVRKALRHLGLSVEDEAHSDSQHCRKPIACPGNPLPAHLNPIACNGFQNAACLREPLHWMWETKRNSPFYGLPLPWLLGLLG